jgi:ribonucleotide reductase beta subunit family protein with ferritin-like domain
VSIADGTIVAAGTNVVKDTEPYAIVGGNPARTIRFRFDTDEIEFLTKLKWWNKDYVWVAEHAQYFSDIKKFKKLVEDEKSN